MKLDWSLQGWRVFSDETDFSVTPHQPQCVIPSDIKVGPVRLCLGKGDEANKGWVYVPNDVPLELVR